MIEVGLTYNPFFVTTEITIDGELVPENSRLAKDCKNSRIQNWIDQFLPKLYDERREKNVTINFRGTELDGDDVRKAVEDFNRNGYNFAVKVIAKKHGDSVSRVTALKKLFEAGKEGPFKELFNSPEIQDAFQKAIDPTFEVNIVGTMSAGKSTVINALLGKKLMPAKNQACTAVVARIKDNDAAPTFTAQRFDRQHKPIGEIQEATKDLLSDWNDKSETAIIEIEGNIPTVRQTDECAMAFVDTPGPNNAQNEEHKRITLETIKSKPLSMVLYVMNTGNLTPEDDRWLLDQVCAAMSAGGRRAQDRFMFLVNKFDAVKLDEETPTAVISKAMEYLERRDGDGIIHGIEKPLIIPVSARLALLIRIGKNNGELTSDESDDLQVMVNRFNRSKEMNMVEHVANRLSADCVKRLRKRIEDATDTKDNEARAEVLSGIPIVEELLNEFLQKHALPAKLKDAVESMNRVLQEAKIAEQMSEQLAQDDSRINEMVAKIKAFTENKDRIEEGKKLRDNITNMKYQMSPETCETVQELQAKAEKLAHDLPDLLQKSGDSLQEQKDTIESAWRQCSNYDSEVFVCLNDALEKESNAMMQAMRKRYQDFIIFELNQNFPDDIKLQQFQRTIMEMPSAEEMIEQNLKIEDNSAWYKPWTWFSGPDIKVDTTGIAKDLPHKLREYAQENIDSFNATAPKNMEIVKDKLLNVMNGIDAKMEKIQTDLSNAQADYAVKEEMRCNNQEKMNWYNDFRKKLDEILAV